MRVLTLRVLVVMLVVACLAYGQKVARKDDVA
jgi:hypothetical protein